MSFICKYIALFVPDLRLAEDFYRRAFGMDLMFRESQRDDGHWYTLRHDLDWEDAGVSGVEPDMVALCREDFVLALFRGTPQPGTVLEFCIGMSPREIHEAPASLPESSKAFEHDRGSFAFEDPFGFRWTVREPETPFRCSGEIAGRWLG